MTSSSTCPPGNEDAGVAKGKKKFYVKKTLRITVFLLSTAAVFLCGQYILAGKLIASSTTTTTEYSSKQRRNINTTESEPKLRFPTSYHVTGILKLPYGGIDEPFEAWYSRDEKMSRIDYYGGMDRTYQRQDLGQYGFGAKIIPEFSEVKKKIFRGCLHHVGTKRFPIKAQSIIPSNSGFKYDGLCTFNKTIPCYRWKHTFKVLTKINSYTLYTSRDHLSVPFQYDMMGYDTLLASYYDKYILLYNTFQPWEFDFSVFEIPSDVHCFDLSGASETSEVTVAAFNPMLEFMSAHSEQDSQPINDNPTEATTNQSVGNESMTSPMDGKKHYEFIVEKIFKDYKDIFKKEYKDEMEHVKRKDIFRHNLRFINNKNRQNLTFKLQLNHFADVTDDEMKYFRGLLNESYVDNNAQIFHPPHLDIESIEVPKTLDWREYGAISDVRSQGICGSCYAYAVTGAVEAAHYLKTGQLIKLSEQQIVDCSWGFGNKGCKGGYPYRAMQWIIKHGGIATRKSYGKYLAQEGYCHFENITHGASIDGYYNVSQGNASQLKMAIAMYGPVTILINTRPKSFKFYDSGVYYDKGCDDRLDHAALAIGYGTTDNGEEYWLVKNSWSVSWGRKGFMKISMKDDICGVTQKAVVVKVK